MLTVALDRRSTLLGVRDQGAAESCVSHATSTAHEHARNLAAALSAEYLHFHAAGGDWKKGVGFARIAHILERVGQPLESACPAADGSRLRGWQPPLAASTFRRHTSRIPPNLDEVLRVLQDGQLPVIGIDVPDPFYTPIAPWIIPPNGTIRCAHAVVAVGAADLATGERALLIRNSWGQAWGDAGHAWLTETFLNAHLRDVIVMGAEAN